MPIGSRGAYTFVDIILAIILPPLGVFLKYGLQVSTIDLSTELSLSDSEVHFIAKRKAVGCHGDGREGCDERL